MSFENQSQQNGEYTEFVAEHQLVVDWLDGHRGRGHPEYLDHRVIDRQRKAVAYYVRGIGRGDGKRYALVQGRNLVVFNAMHAYSVHREHLVRISSVNIPEALLARQDHVRSLMMDACQCHLSRVGLDLRASENIRVEFDERPWQITPTRFSRRYWLQKAGKFKAAAKPRVVSIWRVLVSPLAGTLALTALAALSFAHRRLPLPILLLLPLVGGWLCLRFSRYDSDEKFGYWLIGRTKLKHPWSVHGTLLRLMKPRPLGALKVTLSRSRRTPADGLTLTVLNTSWFPVTYLSISAKAVADLVAPGFSDALRDANAGAIDAKALRAVFPDLQRRWLLPRQAARWEVRTRQEFPLGTSPTQVVAMVAISRRVSGEPKYGAQPFHLPVEVLDH